jgi:spermidine synthase
MALVWQLKQDDVLYEVRSAGSSLRLYTNGAFHSQHSKKHLFTGAIWDLLSIPTCFIKTQSVLMLGVGGGASIHQINRLMHPEQIVGIDFNPVHLKVARDIFKVSGPNIRLELSDARDWVRKHHSQFDVVIDDLFVDAETDPERSFASDQKWLAELNQIVSQKGLLVQNHLSRDAATQTADLLRDKFQSALLLNVPQYENVVLAMFRQQINRRAVVKDFEHRLKLEHPGAHRKLRYQVRQYF